MKIKSLTILLFFFIATSVFDSYARPNTQSVEGIVLTVVKDFLEALKQRDENKIRGLLNKDISLNSLDQSAIENLTDRMMADEITIENYLKIITGNNVRKYLDKKRQGSLVITSYEIIPKVGEENELGKDYTISKFYFVHAIIHHKHLTHAPDKSVEETIGFNKAEINLRPAGGETTRFKIVGFII